MVITFKNYLTENKPQVLSVLCKYLGLHPQEALFVYNSAPSTITCRNLDNADELKKELSDLGCDIDYEFLQH